MPAKQLFSLGRLYQAQNNIVRGLGLSDQQSHKTSKFSQLYQKDTLYVLYKVSRSSW